MTNIILSLIIGNDKKDFTFSYNTESDKKHYERQKRFYTNLKYKILQETLEM